MSHGFEAGHVYSDQPYRGEGLAETLQELARSGALDTPIREVLLVDEW